jgi:AraC-like DNA-binding protein
MVFVNKNDQSTTPPDGILMSPNSEVSPGSAGVPKFDMRLGPDTDGAALALYRQNIELLYRLEFAPEDAARFFSRALTYQLPHAVLARVESVAQTLARGPAEIARGGDQLVIYAQVKGELDANYAGSDRKIGPGDVAIIDYSREIVSRSTDFTIMYLMVPRDMVPPLFLAPSVHGTVLPGASGPGRLIHRTLETLLQTMDAMTLAEADAALDALLTMVAGMLESALARDSGMSASGDALRDKALALIDRNLQNPELSPALLEANLPLSRSGLYRLFEPLGGVRNAILQRRLDRSMRTLLNGGGAKPALRAIARDHGFASEEQFSRAFRTRFGITPTQFYDMVRRKDQAGLAAQAERAGFANLHAWIEHMTEPDGVAAEE